MQCKNCQRVFKRDQILERSLSHINEIENPIDITKKWMDAMISGLSICPYTTNANTAGIPPANIRYYVSDAKSSQEALIDYWNEVDIIISTNERTISTTLLIYPFLSHFQAFADFEEFSKDLDIEMEAHHKDILTSIDNVYFHPQYRFVDRNEQVFILFNENYEPIGQSDDVISAVSYARRSPYPMINILRAPMVKQAQKSMPEGKVFLHNVETLASLGAESLESMLQNRDWRDIPPSLSKQTKVKNSKIATADITDDSTIPSGDMNALTDELEIVAELGDWLKSLGIN